MTPTDCEWLESAWLSSGGIDKLGHGKRTEVNEIHARALPGPNQQLAGSLSHLATDLPVSRPPTFFSLIVLHPFYFTRFHHSPSWLTYLPFVQHLYC